MGMCAAQSTGLTIAVEYISRLIEFKEMLMCGSGVSACDSRGIPSRAHLANGVPVTKAVRKPLERDDDERWKDLTLLHYTF